MKHTARFIILAALAAGVFSAGAQRSAAAPSGFSEARGDSVASTEEAAAGAVGPTRQEIKDEMARIGSNEVPGDTQWERGKSPRTATICSMVLPGLGQLYNGRRYKTILAAGGFGYLMTRAWLESKTAQEYAKERDSLDPGSIDYQNAEILYDFHKENSITYIWWSGAVWLIQVLDAFVDAHLYDVRAVTPTVMRGSDDTEYLALSFKF
jgi:hypothetical protein